MEHHSTISITPRKSAVKTVLIAGLVAGVLDGLAAVIQTYIAVGRGPQVVFKFIASGVFGREAFAGGTIMVFWGVIFHMMIATGWALLLFLIYPKLIILLKNKYLIGIFYGAFVWVMMNLVIVPLSNTPQLSFDIVKALFAIAILIVCVGIPAAMIVHRHYHKTARM